MTTITLNDGNKIPAVGFGVFLIPADGPTYDAVRAADPDHMIFIEAVWEGYDLPSPSQYD